jgi:hypothetical protein
VKRINLKPPIPLYYAGVDTGRSTFIFEFSADGHLFEVAFEVDHISQAVVKP